MVQHVVEQHAVGEVVVGVDAEVVEDKADKQWSSTQSPAMPEDSSLGLLLLLKVC